MPRVGSAVGRVVEVDSVEEAVGLEVVVKAAALGVTRGQRVIPPKIRGYRWQIRTGPIRSGKSGQRF